MSHPRDSRHQASADISRVYANYGDLVYVWGLMPVFDDRDPEHVPALVNMYVRLAYDGGLAAFKADRDVQVCVLST